MITETGLLDELNLLSNTGWKRFTGIPCHWDRGTGSFSLRPRAFLTCGLVLTFCFLSHGGHVLQTVKTTGSWNVLQGEDAILIFFMHGFFLVTYFTLGIFLEPELMKNVFNEMVNFERSHIQNEDAGWKAEIKRRPMVRLTRLTCQMFRITAVEMLPVVVAGGTLLAPKFPMNILTCYPPKLLMDGLELLEPRVPYIVVPLEMGLVSLGNLLLWKFAMKYWALLLAHIAIGCTFISSAILAFERKAISQRQMDNFLLVHRQIQIVTYLFNKLDSKTLVLLLVIMCNAQIFSGLYLLWNVPVFIKMFTAITLVNSMAAMILIFGFCGEVHHTSKKCLKKLGLQAGGMSSYKAKQHRRVMRSLPLVKVHFGGMNFIEKLTPVMFQEFATERFVDTVLLSKSHSMK